MTDHSFLSQVDQAEKKFEHGNTKEAIQEFLELNDHHPNNAQILNNLGVLCYTLGYLKEAYGYLKKAIFADPNYQQAKENLKAVKSSMPQNESQQDVHEHSELHSFSGNETIPNENNYICITTEDNLVVYVSKSSEYYTSNIKYNLSNTKKPELTFIREFIESGMTVLDADTGYGIYALTMAHEMEGEGQVIARNANELFYRSVEENNLQNMITTELDNSSLDFIHLGASELDKSYFTQGSPMVMFQATQELFNSIKQIGIEIFKLDIKENKLIKLERFEHTSNNYFLGCTPQKTQILKEKGYVKSKLNTTKSLKNNNIKCIYFAYPNSTDAHGNHLKRATLNAENIKDLGICSATIAVYETKFLQTILEASCNTGNVIFAGRLGYDVTINVGNMKKNVFDLLNMHVFGTLADHPYSTFMLEPLKNAADKTVIFTSNSLSHELKSIFPNIKNIENIDNFPPLLSSNDSDPSIPLYSRSIDILVPLGIHKFINKPSLESQLNKLDSEVAKLGYEIYDLSKFDYINTVFDNFQSVMLNKHGKKHIFSHHKTQKDKLLIYILNLVDWTIRKERRIQLLENLSKISNIYNIAITSNSDILQFIPELQKNTNINFVGELNIEELARYYAHSKTVINCNPTYPDLISERVKNAMSLGCCVISDYQIELDNTFGNYHGILFMSSTWESINELVSMNINKLQTIADTGRHIVENKFNYNQYLSNIISKIVKYI